MEEVGCGGCSEWRWWVVGGGVSGGGGLCGVE